MFRIWGANCEKVGSTLRTCLPEGVGSSSCEAAVSVPCAEFYHGAPNCSTFCRPTDSCLGHYTCSGSGSRVCLPGWTGTNCTVSVATGSAECTCRNGGTWLNGVCVGEVRPPLVIRLINHIKVSYPTLSDDDQLQLLSALLQQAHVYGTAVAWT